MHHYNDAVVLPACLLCAAEEERETASHLGLRIPVETSRCWQAVSQMDFVLGEASEVWRSLQPSGWRFMMQPGVRQSKPRTGEQRVGTWDGIWRLER